MIKWTVQINGNYRHDNDGIRAAYGRSNPGTSDSWWTANDLRDKEGDQLFGHTCDTLTAKVAAENAILELQRKRA